MAQCAVVGLLVGLLEMHVRVSPCIVALGGAAPDAVEHALHALVERTVGLVGVEAAERLRRGLLHLQYAHRGIARQRRPHLARRPGART